MTLFVDKTKRIVKAERLLYYRDSVDSSFWDQHWRRHFRPERQRTAPQPTLGSFFKEPMLKWLPRTDRILDAGCGLGRQVAALRAMGYDAVGIDLSAEATTFAKYLYPDIPIRIGDATQLQAPDEFYGGYISFGVVEHRQEGPLPFLTEAARVLKEGGVALMSVPWFNPLRRLKARLGAYRGNQGRLKFYQFAFHETEFIRMIQDSGLEVREMRSYDALKGIRDEIPLVRRVLRCPGGRVVEAILNKILFSFPSLKGQVSHMLLVVAQKPQL